MIRKVSYWFVGFGILLMSVALFQGCSSDSNEPSGELGKVSGKVTLDGTVIKKGIKVIFTPASGGGSEGVTDEDGHYELEWSGGGTKGAVLGEHTVSFRDEGEEMEGDVPVPGAGDGGIGIIPPKYATGESSITRTVVAKKDQIFDFDLNSDDDGG